MKKKMHSLEDKVMHLIQQRAVANFRQIANALGLYPYTVSDIVANLNEHELVQIGKYTQGGPKMVVLTERGRKQIFEYYGGKNENSNKEKK